MARAESRIAGHTIASAPAAPTDAQGAQGTGEQYLYSYQGRTFGAPGLTAPAVNSEDGREQARGDERPGWPAVGGRGFTRGLAVAGGSFRRVLRTRALRRGELPPAPRPRVAGRLQSPPYPAAAPACTTAGPTRSRRVRRKP